MTTQNHNLISYCFAETQVKKEDITCVHAAMQSVDPETLLCVLLESRLAWKVDPRKLTGAAKRHLLKKATSILGLMHDIEPVPLKQPDRIIIPVQTFEYPGTGTAFTRRISAALLDVSPWEEDGGTLEYASCIAQCMAQGSEELWTEGLASVDSFIGTAWTEVLGYALWLPSSLTEYERVSELAHLFWVMAFSGFAEAIYEMKAVNMRRHGSQESADSPVALCFQEQQEKMASIAMLFDGNSAIDVRRAAPSLRQALVA